MMNASEANKTWYIVRRIFKDTRELTPSDTILELGKVMSRNDIMEIFAIVTKIKEHDGRIYGKNREVMEAYPSDPEIDYTMIKGLDDIHPAHINQLIGELIKDR